MVTSVVEEVKRRYGPGKAKNNYRGLFLENLPTEIYPLMAEISASARNPVQHSVKVCFINSALSRGPLSAYDIVKIVDRPHEAFNGNLGCEKRGLSVDNLSPKIWGTLDALLNSGKFQFDEKTRMFSASSYRGSASEHAYSE